MINLKENKQVVLFTNYIFGIDPDKLLPLSAFLLEKDLSNRRVTRTPLEVKTIEKLKTDISELHMDSLSQDLLQATRCVEFTDDTLIGEDKRANIKRSIEIQLNPCLVDCYLHTFTDPPASFLP